MGVMGYATDGLLMEGYDAGLGDIGGMSGGELDLIVCVKTVYDLYQDIRIEKAQLGPPETIVPNTVFHKREFTSGPGPPDTVLGKGRQTGQHKKKVSYYSPYLHLQR